MSRQQTSSFYVGVLFLACAFPWQAIAAPRLFRSDATYYSHPYGGTSVATADLDRDGYPDLVLLEVIVSAHAATFDEFTIWAGSATGLVDTPRNSDLGAPRGGWIGNQLALADLDGDGWTDVVIVSGAGLRLLRNLGNFKFADPVSLPLPALYGWSVAVGDMNGDGRPDIALASTEQSVVRLYWGTGSFTFTAGPVLQTHVGPDRISIADLNRDQQPDLVVGARDSSTILDSHGAGVFVAREGLDGNAFIAGDLNRDGNPDIITQRSILLGFGNGYFAPPILHGFDSPVATADMDGDGVLDLIVMPNQSVAPGPRVLLARGLGNGHFATAQAFRCASSPRQIPVVTDFDHDGMMDLCLVTSGGGDPWLMHGTGAGQLEQALFIPTPETPTHFAVGRMNGDAIPDLVLYAGTTNTLRNMLSGPNGSYSFSSTTPALSLTSVHCADFDGDGRDDVVGSYASGNGLSIWLTQPDGTLGSRADFTLASDVTSIAALQPADLNGDGRSDLVILGYVASQLPFTYVLLRHSDGSFGLSGRLPHVIGATVVDINGDGLLDIVGGAHGTVDLIRELLATAPGRFSGLSMVDLPLDVQFVAVARVDDDFLPDVLTFSLYTTQQVAYLRNLGGGVLDTSVTLPGALRSGCTDLDRDGRPDQLEPPAEYTLGPRVRHGLGNATFEDPQGIGVTQLGPGEMYAPDFNGDGYPDLCVAVSGGVSILMNRSIGALAAPPADAPRPAEFHVNASPNPCMGIARLQLTFFRAGSAHVELFGIDGRRWSAREVSAVPGVTYMTLTTGAHLPPGIYLARVRQGNEVATARLCVLR